MGNRTYRPRFTEWDLDGLEKVTTLSSQQYLRLYHQYKNNQAWGGQNMDDKTFFQKYNEILPGEQTKRESDRAFYTFDYNKSGKLSFEEFVSAIVVLNKGSTTFDRIAYLIDQFNPNKNDNVVEESYGILVFDRLNQYYGINDVDPVSSWSELVNTYASNPKRVSRDEFLTFIAGHPIYITHIRYHI